MRNGEVFYRGLFLDTNGSHWFIRPRTGFPFPRSLRRSHEELDGAKTAIDEYLQEQKLVDFSDPCSLLPSDYENYRGWGLHKDKATLKWFVEAPDGIDLPADFDGQWTDVLETRKAVDAYISKSTD